MNLCNEQSDQEVLTCLKVLETVDLKKQLKALESTSEEYLELTAVFNRVKFLRLLLQSLVFLYPVKSDTPDELGMAEIARLLSSAAEVMPAIKRTIDRGTPANLESKNRVWNLFWSNRVIKNKI